MHCLLLSTRIVYQYDYTLCTHYRYHDKHRDVEGIDAMLELSMESLLQQNQQALQGIASNFPIPGKWVDLGSEL